MSRWVVESVNGRLKNVFPYFKHTIEGTYVPKIMRFVRIACAILNKSFTPLFEDLDFHDEVVNATINLVNSKENPMKKEVEELGLMRMTVKWEKATAESVPDFPKLSWDDLKKITLGSYQLKIAARYNLQHLQADSNYGIYLHRDMEGIIRAKIDSRYRKSKTHSVWIKYSAEDGYAGIKAYFCTCKVGERTLGCCSHLAAVMRYLGHDRYNTVEQRKREEGPWGAIDCGDVSGSESEDEE